MNFIPRSTMFVGLLAMSATACGSDGGSKAHHDSPDGGVDAGSGGSSGGEGGSLSTGGVGGTSTGGKGGGSAGDGGVADGGPSAADGGDVDGGVTGRLGNLKNLGANVGLASGPRDPKGNVLPDSYHPLKKPYAVMDPRKEIYFAGPTLGGQREGLLDDGYTSSNDFAGTFGEMMTPARTWTTTRETSSSSACTTCSSSTTRRTGSSRSTRTRWAPTSSASRWAISTPRRWIRATNGSCLTPPAPGARGSRSTMVSRSRSIAR
ncbi:MAG TPA: hypothetical protein VH062_23210 [Polyangiaceae bacterium]|nr:hypothetical protein [Polyangiaceae bacterium]